MFKNYKIAFFITLCGLALSSCNDNNTVFPPEGFYIASHDKSSYFVLVNVDYWGDKLTQRSAGAKICDKLEQNKNYCEVYFFADEKDIPTSFPIINRKHSMGIFERKNGKTRLKTLPAPEDSEQQNKIVTFFRSLYENFVSNNEDRKKAIQNSFK